MSRHNVSARTSWFALSAFYKPAHSRPPSSPATMAIHPKLSPSPSPAQQQQQQQQQPQGVSLSPQQTTEISAWTEEASQSLRDFHISTSSAHAEQSPTPAARDSSSNLVIPLDVDHHHHHRHRHHHAEQTPTQLRVKNVRVESAEADESARVVYRRREPIHRDSLKRREALLKGKEGSRRRQRWENGTFYGHVVGGDFQPDWVTV